MEGKTYADLQKMTLKPFIEYNLCVKSLNARTQQRKLQRRLSRQLSRKSETSATEKETPTLDALCQSDEMLWILGIKQELSDDVNDRKCSNINHQESNQDLSESGYGVDEEARAVMEINGVQYDFDPDADFHITEMTPAGYCHYSQGQNQALPTIIPTDNRDYGTYDMVQPYTYHNRPNLQEQKPAHNKPKQKKLQRGCRLWEFIRDLLQNPRYNPSHIRWVDRQVGEFRLIKSNQIARMWGEKKNNDCMTYEKLSRAMRYYYKRGILAPVLGKRLVYRFGEKSHGWK